ncbi:uncharacterized protein [Solanum tuberosum]|uniref:uncharacterized protein n=1 Tax=Solanum tuberosum TaxID=4113 RepID=UPI00073A2F70|nr:PREDICTED: uncharacterized protein LOC107061169 [Solanum tuberosum]
MVHSDDEYDEDTQSIEGEEEDKDGEEVSAHLIKTFGSTFQSEFQKDIQEVAEQQGLSPRGRKQDKQNYRQTSKSTSAQTSRPNTRSKSRACGLMDLGYTGQTYTWCNHRNEEARVWKRLDRAMVNDNWLQGIPQTTITHLHSVGSDHCPLLMEIVDKVKQPIKYFKFLHCWTKHEEFNNVVKACWDREVEGNPMWRLQQKMKRLTATPSNWSKTTYGDIFSIVRDHEERVRVAEEALIVNNSTENRANLHMINARYIKYLKLEDSILKQKTQLQWFKDGDTNSKYFHAIMRGRRRKLFIHKVCIGNEEWVEGYENIAKAACDHFKNIFTGTEQPINEDILQHIPRMVTLEQNTTLQAIPTSEELQQVVFSMNPNSAPGPDGLAPMLPNIISNNQSGFVIGRSISESVMLAQEIIHGIKKPKEGDNVVIKLDMTKAYDRVSWAFTSLVLRHMGFGEFFIDIVWKIMSNNWYSIIVNGTRHGFFHSTRGLKQGDPLSPSLFILGAEVLSRMLNNLYDNQHFHGFQIDFRGPQINHLSFADDVIIFTSGREESLKLIMETLSTYEDTSDQLINKGKSHFMVPKDTPSHIIDMIQEITGFNQRESPINYLGCPLYIGGQRII